MCFSKIKRFIIKVFSELYSLFKREKKAIKKGQAVTTGEKYRLGWRQTFNGDGYNASGFKQTFRSELDFHDQFDRSLPDDDSKNQTWGNISNA
jgi:hypothetical protein